jgi:hypothetical protein
MKQDNSDAGRYPGSTKGRLVMLALLTFALLAVAIAFPGLVAVVMSRGIDAY